MNCAWFAMSQAAVFLQDFQGPFLRPDAPRILDVGNDNDKIDLFDVASIRGFRDLRNDHTMQDGSDLMIDDKDGNTLTLNGLTIGDLDRGDFIF